MSGWLMAIATVAAAFVLGWRVGERYGAKRMVRHLVKNRDELDVVNRAAAARGKRRAL